MIFRAGCAWPRREHEQLLQAGLRQGPAASTAFEAWADATDFDRLDVVSQRLLPLVFRNLGAHELGHPSMPRIRGLYRRTWYRNQLLFGALSRVIHALNEAGIPSIVLKGVALSDLHYRDRGARPMSDADILVATARYRDAMTVVKSLGWHPKSEANHWPPRYCPDWPFVHADGFELDLHAHLLPQGLYPGADDRFWARAVPFDLNDVPARALSAADALFHVIAHGLRWDAVPAVRWVADATMIIRSADRALLWDDLVTEARRWRMTRTVHEALRYLQSTFDVAVPRHAHDALDATPVSVPERWEHAAKLLDPSGGFVVSLSNHWFVYARTCAGYGRSVGPIGFGRHLADVWGVDAVRLPQVLAEKAGQRLWRSLRRRMIVRGMLNYGAWLGTSRHPNPKARHE